MSRIKEKVVVLTGAGISAESGISTFRDAGGLWENHDIMEVASYQGWQKNPSLVLDFYNQRRRQLKGVQPNAAHTFLVDLESDYDVTVITQNVDDLHERAGSSKVLHLHGQLRQVRSTKNEQLVYSWTEDLHLGDLAADKSQLRPNIVWFGEPVPAMSEAIQISEQADVFIIIGTSLSVYPAASLFEFTRVDTPIIIVNPDNTPQDIKNRRLYSIEKTACSGLEDLKSLLLTANFSRLDCYIP